MIETVKSLLKGMFSCPALTKKVLDIKGKVYTKIKDLDVTALTSDEPLKKSEVTDGSPIKKGFEWAEKKFGACWFRVKGEVPTEYLDKHTVVIMSIGGEGVAYDGEETVDIITPILSVTDVLQPPTAGKRVLEIVKDGKVDSLIDCGHNGYSGKFINKAIFRYAYLAEKNDELCDYYYDFVTLALLLGTAEGERFSQEVKEELEKILDDSYNLFKKGDVAAAKEELGKYYNKKQDYESVLYTMVGQAHLDLAWLWPERESKRKAVRTFTNAISTIEKNPSYVFGASQAQMFKWVKDSHPLLFEKIKKYVATGNIELQGGMWVECDCNMPSGESLIRQFLHGDKFFKENFGKTSDIAWLPDAFGFPHTLPQIIKGVGKSSFVTIKLNWNKVNKFPYQSFYWVAPDGSKVLSHISPEGTYYNDGTPIAVAKAERRNVQKQTGRALIIYGVGDGGGGPGEGHVEIAKRTKELYGSARTVLGSAESFFADLKNVELPDYDGELYLEKHQGTLTSQSENKRLNRLAERELHTAEWLMAITERPENIDELWQRLLFTQFHDVLPGSSIERVHKESREDLKKVIEKAGKIIADRIELLSDGNGLSALNPSPFAREEYVTVNGASYRFVGKGYSAGPLLKKAPSLSVDRTSIENELVKITFKNGKIVSYLDKKQHKEKSLGGLNVLKIFHDKKTKYNAWDIEPDYVKHSENLRFVSMKTYIEGSNAVAETKFTYGKSTVKQKIYLSGGTTVRINTEADWRETNKMLRAEFYPTIYSDTAECDIQFGHVDRSTGEDNDLDRAKFEICAHKYISVKNAEGAFALYSDCKYGYRAKNGLLSINLLRSPKYPDETCDMGERRFSYAMDFADDGREIVRRAYNFSYPLIVTDKVVKIEPIVNADSENIIVETIKPVENGKGFAVRLYERFGEETETKISVGRYKIYSTDLLENNPVEEKSILRFRPHEIKTIVADTRISYVERG